MLNIKNGVLEKDLSMQWLDYHKELPGDDNRLKAVYEALAKNRTIGAKSSLLVGVVSAICEAVTRSVAGSNPAIVYAPVVNNPVLKDDPSHCALLGLIEMAAADREVAAIAIARVVKAHLSADYRPNA